MGGSSSKPITLEEAQKLRLVADEALKRLQEAEQQGRSQDEILFLELVYSEHKEKAEYTERRVAPPVAVRLHDLGPSYGALGPR